MTTVVENQKNRRRQRDLNKQVVRTPTKALQERHDKFLSIYGGCLNATEAASEVGVKRDTVEQWRTRYPQFNYAYSRIRAKAKGEFEAKVLPFDAAFRERFFRQPDWTEPPTPPHLDTLMRVINEQVAIADKEQRRDRRVLVLMAPESGKSTVGVEEYIAYRTAMDATFRSSIVCSTSKQAEKRLGAIARMLTDRTSYADLIDTYGPFKSESRHDMKPWTAHHLTHLRAPANQRDYCVDEETEIMTASGWKRYDEVRDGEPVLTLNTYTRESEWQPAKIHVFPARPREMIRMEGQAHSSLTTKDHRWFVRHRSRDTGRDSFIWRTSETLSKATAIPTAAPHADPMHEPKFSDALVELVAWYWTEGSLHKVSENNWRAQIGQSHRVNPAYVDRIRSCLREVFGEPVRGLKDGTGWAEYVHERRGITMFNIWTNAAKFLDEICPDKVPTGQFLRSLTQAQLRLFIETSIDADGWRSRQVMFTQKDERRIRAFEMACVLAGLEPRTWWQENQGWCCCVVRRGKGFTNPVDAASRPKKDNRLKVERVQHSGIVWCPETENGTWLARRRGTVYYTGNTVQALGWTGEIYGDRNDLIVFDDIATQKNQTLAIIEAQWEKIWGEFRTRIRKGGLFLVVGTRVREGDIYSVMEQKGFFTDVVILPAIVREPGTLSDDDPGEALWEEGTSMEELLSIRDTDPRLFELMYMQNPLPSVGAVFPHDAIESCYDDMRTIGDIPEGSVVVAGVDPSVNNYTAGVVFAMKRTHTGEWMRYLVDVWNEKNLTGDGGDNHIGVVDFIVELCRTYRVAVLCVEDGAWMSLINNAFTLRSKLYDLGVRHIPIKATEQTVGAEAIRQLSGLFTHRLISLPGTPSAKAHLHEFEKQLLMWTGEKSHWRKSFDIVKALRQAEHAAKMLAKADKPYHASSLGPEVSGLLEEVSVA